MSTMKENNLNHLLTVFSKVEMTPEEKNFVEWLSDEWETETVTNLCNLIEKAKTASQWKPGRKPMDSMTVERVQELRLKGLSIRKIQSELKNNGKPVSSSWVGSVTKDYDKMLEWIEEETLRIMEKESEEWNNELYDNKGDWIFEFMEHHEGISEQMAEEQWKEYYDETIEQWTEERKEELFEELKEEWENS